MDHKYVMLAQDDAVFIAQILDDLLTAGLKPMDRELVRMARARLVVASLDGEIVPLESAGPPGNRVPQRPANHQGV